MKLSVVGLGKLGSPLLAVLASKGHNVIGTDLNRAFIHRLNEGIAPVIEPGLQELLSRHRSNFKAVDDCESAILSSDVTFVIVPTPSDSDGLFSNEYILQAIQKIGHSLRKKSSYHLVVITSTVMPGSTGGDIRKALEEASLRSVGKDVGLCYSPKFIALGSVIKNMLFPDMVLIGESDLRAGDLLETIYRSVCENNPPVKRMNFVNAELAKIALNTFVTTKISFANMLSDLCQRLDGGDVDVVTSAVGLDARVGPKYLRGAVAFGGPCFPRDNIALGALGKKVGAHMDLAYATQETNQYQFRRLLALADTYGRNKKIGILGLAYKVGTHVAEESQGVTIANLLSDNGYEVSVYDPMAIEEAASKCRRGIRMACSVQACVEASDVIFIMTAWPEFAQEITPSFLGKLEGRKVIIDCWRLLPRSTVGDLCELVYLGCDNHPSGHAPQLIGTA